MTRPMFSFNVAPSLPKALLGLRELAYNLWWTWNPEARELFRQLDRAAWEASRSNPVRMLGLVDQARLDSAAGDDGFVAHLQRISADLARYMKAKSTWYQKTNGPAPDPLVAYFCFEYGLTESLPVYSGGMGVLAGDYLKSASDLGMPLAAVGLAYQQGYFHQYLNADGWQGERYPENDFNQMPMQPELRSGSPLSVDVEYPGRRVSARVWRVNVGRVPLYLLDANVSQNQPEDRRITNQLYGGDVEMRIQQEIMLGIGGLQALRAVGIEPRVCHMNEGHAAFLAIERIHRLVQEEGLSFGEAREMVRAGTLFTTHTSVPAGIDLFAPHLIDRYLGRYYDALGISRQDFLALGRQQGGNEDEPFSMAVLALRLAAQTNAVSKLHQEVSRGLWQNVWPGVPEAEVPIACVRNGIHTRSWISLDQSSLFDRYLGPRWSERPADPAVWDAVDEIPDEELWRVHERRRARLVAFARRRLQGQLEQRGASPSEIAAAAEILDPKVLTIGFARRFATYKRATLLLHDAERLGAILGSVGRPVQVIFAGKAHPRDDPAKGLIRELVHRTRYNGLRNVVFIEDYDVAVARYMLQGADLWLNTPRLLQEASGTSGMKAAANGALNLSVLDGWWAEGYQPDIGWAIGRGEVYEDLQYQDNVESNAIYDLLEKSIVPLFYDRRSDDLPHGWIARMKKAMRAVTPVYNTGRMATEYMQLMYAPALERHSRLAADRFARARRLAEWKSHVGQHWSEVQVAGVEPRVEGEAVVGAELEVRASIKLGQLSPDDVAVELYHGGLDAEQDIEGGVATPMEHLSVQRGIHLFGCKLRLQGSGLRGYTLRVLPRHEDLDSPFIPGLIRWAS